MKQLLSAPLTMCTLVQEYECGFQIPYVYNYMTKLCRQQAQVIHNHENANFLNSGQGGARTENM
jgi:hypothetical protein